MFRRKRHSRYGIASPATVFAISLCIAALRGLLLRRDNEAAARAQFLRAVERVSDEIARRF